MYTIKDLKLLVKQVEEHEENLLRIGSDEKKEFGRPLESTCMSYNALIIAVNKAVDELYKGLCPAD